MSQLAPGTQVTARLEISGGSMSHFSSDDLNLYTPDAALIDWKRTTAPSLAEAMLLYFKVVKPVDERELAEQIAAWAETRMPGVTNTKGEIVAKGSWPGLPTQWDTTAIIMNGIVVVAFLGIAKVIFPNFRIPIPRITFRRPDRRRSADQFGPDEIERWMRERPDTAADIVKRVFGSPATSASRPAPSYRAPAPQQSISFDSPVPESQGGWATPRGRWG